MILSFTCNGLTRRIQRLENAVVAVRQDSAVDTVRMIFRPEEFNNISLATVSVKFLYVDNTDGEIKAYQTGTTPDGGVYVADWELTDDVVDDAGYINFAVKLAIVNGDTVEKQWFSIPDTFRVYDSVDDTNNPPGETAEEQATNAEKIAQLQSQLGTATSELSSLTSTVALQGAALDTLKSNTCRLMGITVIAANTDMNTLTTIGEYALTGAANASTLQNKPSDLNTAFRMRVELMTAGNDNYIRQTIFVFSSDVVYTRYSTNGGSAWNDWVKQPTRAEIDTLTNAKSDTAGYHNGIYRGKDITAYLTDGTLWNRINGTGGYSLFEDLFLGDYITVGNNSYAIVDFDYYYHGTYTDLNVHHIVMMPVGDMNIPAGTTLYGTSDTLTFINTANAGQTVTSQESATAFKWNATMSDPNTNTTNGGYKYSRMRTVIMKAANTIVINAFGAEHVKPLSVIYPNPASETATAFTAWDWFTNTDQSNIMSQSICDLPNETQVYGAQVWGQWNTYNGMGNEVGCDKWQFAIFRLQRNFGSYRGAWWLRSVASASWAAIVSYNGGAGNSGAALAGGVRPRFLLVG